MLKWFAHIINLLSPKKIEPSIYDAKLQEINRKLKITQADGSRYVSANCFKLQFNCLSNSKEIAIFSRYKFRVLLTLSFLKEERIRKEKDRIARAIRNINIKLSEIDKYVNIENLDKSEQLLSEIDAIFGTIPDNVEVRNNISKRRDSIQQLSKILEQREEEKRIAQSIQDINSNLFEIDKYVQSKNLGRAEQLLSEIDEIVSTIHIERSIKDRISERKTNIRELRRELKKKEEEAGIEKNIREINSKLFKIDEYVQKEDLNSAEQLLSDIDDIYRMIPWERESEVDGKISRQRDSVQKLSETLAERGKKKEIFEQNGICYLYHFTAKENLDSIREHGGLYSWDYCDKHNIRISTAGGGDLSRSLDKGVHLEDYVRLSFCRDHPMAYRVWQRTGKDIVLLKIKLDVAYIPETRFTDINAADGNFKIGADANFIAGHINFRATKRTRVKNTDPDFKLHQAEVLVKTFVPIDYIINIDSPDIMHFG